MERRKLGTVFGFTVTVRLGIVGALSLLVILLSIGYAFLPTYREPLTYFALALTAAATIGGAFYVAETIREQADQEERKQAFELDQEKRKEAFGLIARWNSPDLLNARSSWNRISSEFQTNGAGSVKNLLLDPKEDELTANVRHILNFLEEIAIAIRYEHASSAVLKDAFDSIVARAQKAFAEWIPEHRRLTGRNDIWDEFETLAKNW